MGSFCGKPRAADQFSSPPPEGMTTEWQYKSSAVLGANDTSFTVLTSTIRASSSTGRHLNKDTREKLAYGTASEPTDLDTDYHSVSQSEDRTSPPSLSIDTSTFMSLATVVSHMFTTVTMKAMLSGLGILSGDQIPGIDDSTYFASRRSCHLTADRPSVTGDCQYITGNQSVTRNEVVYEAEDSGVDDSDDSCCYDNPHTKMSGIGDLAITKPAPQFEAQAVVDGEFKTVKLTDYRGKYVVLFFYPLDFTFVCPTEIISFSDRVADFRSINCEVLACSTDSVFSHLAWINTPRKQGGLGPMNIPLIADKNAEISKKYGCLKGDEGIAFRGLYIIDDKGNLRQITINDLPVGRSVDETLRLVQAFQFTDKHGEVCPAGWKPGSETLKPNAKGISEYLSKH